MNCLFTKNSSSLCWNVQCKVCAKEGKEHDKKWFLSHVNSFFPSFSLYKYKDMGHVVYLQAVLKHDDNASDLSRGQDTPVLLT